MKAKKHIDKKTIQKAVSASSKLEGLSFRKAKKDTEAIKILKKHGRAFAL